ncbi:uncharacterized protein VTP21DRAFT_8873 [Calcarisporiella thermophila]|uniref:uncharacterized protein n=1 Tax=Calcarisporiella thermophila TaxID=911321 RepID=UPI003742DDDD
MMHAFFLSDNLRDDLRATHEQIIRSVDPQIYNLPAEVYTYHSLLPLESLQSSEADTRAATSSRIFGYPTSAYRTTSSVDGEMYTLQRVEGFRLTSEAPMAAVESWRGISHASIVGLREAFTTKAFGDHSLVFVYDYYPGSITLYQKHFVLSKSLFPTSPSIHGIESAPGGPMPEAVLWSYITQLASALRVIHKAGLAARVFEPSKILITGKNRLRINCCGMLDVLQYDSDTKLNQMQQEDLVQLGRLILALATGSLSLLAPLHHHQSSHHIHHLRAKAIELITRHYSPDIKNLLNYLLRPPGAVVARKSVDDIVAMVGPRILHELNSTQHYTDFLEDELNTDLENDRLLRLMCKWGFMNERQEYDQPPYNWSESGQWYPIKLFRDYVFHAVDEQGRPILDFGHVLTCLNKLDAGIDEKITLTSRDEHTWIIVTYRELRTMMQDAFRELVVKK